MSDRWTSTATVSPPVGERPLAGAHALVTGAGRGIGRACVLSLVRAGATVTAMSRTLSELEELRDLAPGRIYPFAGDVTDPDVVDAAVAAADEHGELTVCVHSAGTNRTGPTETYAIDDFDLVLSANVRSTFLVCRAVGRSLLAREAGGSIVTVSSQMGAVGYPGRAAYCASKHAVNGLTKALAVEWASRGIRVNAVAPTFIRTPLTEPMLANDAFREDVLRRIPAGRIGEVGEVAAAVLFLASPASSLVTGEVLAVDGGWTAW